MSERVALVTGAGRGIGREVARGLAARGLHTVIGARDPQRGAAVVRELSEDGRPVSLLPLDVTDDQSVAAAAARLEEDFGRLDVLVNNAGVLLDTGIAPSTLPVKVLASTFEVNVFGVVRVTNAMLPLLRRPERATIVNVSSAMGSLTLATDESWQYHDLLQAAYNSSKSALNAITVQYAKELKGGSITVNAVHPGVCATGLNGHVGPRSADDGAAVIVAFATTLQGRPSGGFFDDAGPLPW